MSAARTFVDSNVVLYLLSADTAKADRAEQAIGGDVVISVQVLNEVATVARRKLRMSWPETNELLKLLRSLCPVEAVTVATHDLGIRLAQRYGVSIYDAMILASASLAGCGVIYSEDMQHGLLVDRRLRIRNPFI